MLIDGVLQFKLNDEVYTAEFEEQLGDLVTEKTGALTQTDNGTNGEVKSDD
jgi:hypothetical protein